MAEPSVSEEEERAAIKLQALMRGKSDREYFNLVRDEEACVCHAELEPTPMRLADARAPRRSSASG